MFAFVQTKNGAGITNVRLSVRQSSGYIFVLKKCQSELEPKRLMSEGQKREYGIMIIFGILVRVIQISPGLYFSANLNMRLVLSC
jgi:hypothetical protein